MGASPVAVALLLTATVCPLVSDAGVPVSTGPAERADSLARDTFPFPRPDTGLSCAEFARALRTFDEKLAYDPPRADVWHFGVAIADWLDAYGFWVPPQGAIETTLEQQAPHLLDEVQPRGTGAPPVAVAPPSGCPITEQLGERLFLETEIARARFLAPSPVGEQISWSVAMALPLDEIVHSTPVTKARAEREPGKGTIPSTKTSSSAPPAGAKGAARAGGPSGLPSVTLGDAANAVAAKLGARGKQYRDALERQLFPVQNASLGARILREALLRAWVPRVDGHGSWAPASELTQVIDTDLTDEQSPRLFGAATPTVGGVRIDSGARAPLANGDILIAVEPGAAQRDDPWQPAIYLAGLTPEAVDEVAVAAFSEPDVDRVAALWLHDGALIANYILREPSPKSEGETSTEPQILGAPPAADLDAPYILPSHSVPWGDGRLLIVPPTEVRDEFGLDLRALLKKERLSSPPLRGVVLDLRGNGGGSMDGAIDALAAFLPDATLFPLATRRAEELTVDHTEIPPADERWEGPVAALVDSDTASAAEMLAGALSAYERGDVVGTKTFGKGCVQTFEEDHALAGGAEPGRLLLTADSLGGFRVTTYIYALPNGKPVQRRGIDPTLPFPFPLGVREPPGLPPRSRVLETEATNPAAPPTFAGPDVRERTSIGHAIPFGDPGPNFVSRCLASLPMGSPPLLDAATCRGLARLAKRR